MAKLEKSDKILVTGATGLIGQNLVRALKERGYAVQGVGSKDYDLRDWDQVKACFTDHQPTYLIHLAARVGGIYANMNSKAGFYMDNTLINTFVINEAVNFGVKHIFAMGTGCAYPKRLEGELLEEKDYLDGTPESTNDAYAYAKRNMLVHLQALAEEDTLDYAYCLPANIYGPFDNFHPLHSHAAPGLIRRFCDAVDNNLDEVSVWGDGTAERDLLYIDDCIDSMIMLCEQDCKGVINIGWGKPRTIRSLVEAVVASSGFQGKVVWDTNMPTGQKTRLMSTERVSDFGWKPTTSLEDGVAKTVKWFRENRDDISER